MFDDPHTGYVHKPLPGFLDTYLKPCSWLIRLNSLGKNFFDSNFFMVEPLLSGIVLGLVPVTIAGLFVTAYLQYRRGDQATW